MHIEFYIYQNFLQIARTQVHKYFVVCVCVSCSLMCSYSNKIVIFSLCLQMFVSQGTE